MIVADLIKEKDYDYIEWRSILPEKLGGGDIFTGSCKSLNGELVSLDGDHYSKETEVLEYEEWDNPLDNITNGITIIYDAKFKTQEESTNVKIN